jgi:hypothetical protein
MSGQLHIREQASMLMYGLETSAVDVISIAAPATVSMARRLERQGAFGGNNWTTATRKAANLVGVACAEAALNLAILLAPQPETVGLRLLWQVGADRVADRLTVIE